MGFKFNPFTGTLDTVDSPSGVFEELDVNGDITLDDGGTYTTTLQTITATANRTISLPDATGTVALVAGSSGQLVYNNAGAQAGAPGSTVGATGDITLTLNGAASTPPLELTGTWFTGGSTTATKPQLLIEPTGTTSNAWSTSGTGLGVNAASTFGGRLFDFQVNGTSRAVLDSAGRLLCGTASSTSNARLVLQANSGSATGGAVALFQNGQSAATIGSTATDLGYIWFADNAGNRFAEIIGQTDGTAGTNDYPGRLVFYTTPDGSPTSVERMRITSTGSVEIGTTAVGNPSYLFVRSSGGETAFFDRQTSDGVIIALRQDNTTEGTISVSGTTVSYNGGHLSRWSQLPNGAERTEILRGSVLSNIDEMCEWGEEDNEQLNRMKVSEVEGDKNVSGVFQDWDDDDDTYTDDFYCAMTGDFIIRIAGDVTVERGDLLMSAGDGTAKPQDDDIIRSKTIAKVTSTNVSCTYPDGSYCVPCVLMAC